MEALHGGIVVLAAKQDTNPYVAAAITLGIAIALAIAFDRLLARRGLRVAEAVTRGELRPVIDTRLRLIRRLVYALIIGIGVFNALNQFEGLGGLATSLLTSSAIAAAVVGFAARQVLANVVAGVMLAITQPLRIGDWVTLDDNYGRVEDIKLNFTVLRTPADQRIVIPNEKLVTGILRNDTLISDEIGLDVSVWLPPEADAQRALEALEAAGIKATVAEHVPEGARLALAGDRVAPPERYGAEAALRARALSTLRAAGLLPLRNEEDRGLPLETER